MKKIVKRIDAKLDNWIGEQAWTDTKAVIAIIFIVTFLYILMVFLVVLPLCVMLIYGSRPLEVKKENACCVTKYQLNQRIQSTEGGNR